MTSERTGNSVSVRTGKGCRIEYIRIGKGAWGGSIDHADAVALHACLRAAIAECGRQGGGA